MPGTEFFIPELNNREIAIAIWLAVFCAWIVSNTQLRRSIGGVFRAFFVWKLQLVVWLAIGYVALIVVGLWRCGLWDVSNLKTTILWFISTAFVMLCDAPRAERGQHYLRRLVIDSVSGAILVEFLVNFYAFSLPAELVFVPIVSILPALIFVAERNPEHKQVHSLLTGVMALLGLFVISFSIYRVVENFDAFAQVETAVEAFLPVVLSLLLIPFLWVFVVVMSYENLFVRMRYFVPDPALRRYTKWRLVLTYGLRMKRLDSWSRALPFAELQTRRDVIASIRDVLFRKPNANHGEESP